MMQDVCLHYGTYSLSPETAWISSSPRPSLAPNQACQQPAPLAPLPF